MSITQTISRRQMLGFGMAALSLPFLLRQRALAANESSDTAVIFVSLGGGASHHETYDPKPDAPAEYRGEFKAIRTSVPGISFCELLPKQARLADDLAIVRSVTHREGSHIALHCVETGYFLKSITNILRGEMPSIGAIVAKVRGSRDGLPANVSIPKPIYYSGTAYLGGQYDSFNVDGNPNDPEFRINNLTISGKLTADVMHDRSSLLQSFGGGRRTIPSNDTAEAIDAFQRQALDLLTGEKARQAFDLNRESDRIRDVYGRTAFGQRLLMARRLVDAGVPFIHVRTFDWDDHVKLPERMSKRCPEFDNGLAALITDLKQRGRQRDVLIVAMGEFGRTPKINGSAGRDHWPAVASVLISGGRYKMGQVIGASDAQGGQVASAAYAPQNVLGMMYRHLGIDPGTTFIDHTGRPRHVLEEREPIVELG